ncbi:Uma2 family endonuclease [Kitasatospora purpeofusca]|uniref:Uma2 family endonuclease n=1 Tax=Kitasatospora purpeofusca TaxID=67352 RepID=UPI00056D125E|nr:Uma2 family endonuclease [Kitasatospora purpeofusca]
MNPGKAPDEPTWVAQRLWEARAALEVPEGFHAEIGEGAIVLTPVGDLRHMQVNQRVFRALCDRLQDSGWGPAYAGSVVHGLKVAVPDLFVAPDEIHGIEHPEGLGVLASGVVLVVETVSPGSENRRRDLVLKHRAYATAGIPVYVIIDDYDDGGAVTVLSGPDPERGAYASSVRTPYGEDAVVPEGPAKGFVFGPGITGERRG